MLDILRHFQYVHEYTDQSAYNNHRTDMSKQLRRQNTTSHLSKLVKILNIQNYFRFEIMTYLQPDGLAMGAPKLLNCFCILLTAFGIP